MVFYNTLWHNYFSNVTIQFIIILIWINFVEITDVIQNIEHYGDIYIYSIILRNNLLSVVVISKIHSI